jgi:hypothetical protein
MGVSGQLHAPTALPPRERASGTHYSFKPTFDLNELCFWALSKSTIRSILTHHRQNPTEIIHVSFPYKIVVQNFIPASSLLAEFTLLNAAVSMINVGALHFFFFHFNVLFIVSHFSDANVCYK